MLRRSQRVDGNQMCLKNALLIRPGSRSWKVNGLIKTPMSYLACQWANRGANESLPQGPVTSMCLDTHSDVDPLLIRTGGRNGCANGSVEVSRN